MLEDEGVFLGLADPSITPPVNTVLTPPSYMYFDTSFFEVSTTTFTSVSSRSSSSTMRIASWETDFSMGGTGARMVGTDEGVKATCFLVETEGDNAVMGV